MIYILKSIIYLNPLLAAYHSTSTNMYMYHIHKFFFKSTEKPHHFHLQKTTTNAACCVLTNVSLVTSMAQAHSVPSNHSPGKAPLESGWMVFAYDFTGNLTKMRKISWIEGDDRKINETQLNRMEHCEVACGSFHNPQIHILCFLCTCVISSIRSLSSFTFQNLFRLVQWRSSWSSQQKVTHGSNKRTGRGV